MRWGQGVNCGMYPIFDSEQEKQEYEAEMAQQRRRQLREKYPLTDTAWEAIESYRCWNAETTILSRLHRVCVIEGIPSHADQGLEEDLFFYRAGGQWCRAYTAYQKLRQSGFSSSPGADAVPPEADVAIAFMEEPFLDPPIYVYVRGEAERIPNRTANLVVAAASQRVWQALHGQGDRRQALISFFQVGRCVEHRLDAAQELGNYLGSPCDLWATNDPWVHRWLADYCRELFAIIGNGEAEMTLGQQRREQIIKGWLQHERPLVSLEDLIGVELTAGIPEGLTAEALAYLFGVTHHFKGEWLKRMANCIEKERARVKGTP